MTERLYLGAKSSEQTSRVRSAVVSPVVAAMLGVLMMLNRTKQTELEAATRTSISRRLMARAIAGMVSLLTIVMVATPSAAQAADPADFVQDLGRRVSTELGQDDLDQSERERRFGALLDDVVDLDEVGALVLGQHWDQASAIQRADFVREFRSYLIHNFASRIRGFGDRRLVVIESEQDGGTVVLHTEIREEDRALPIEWRLVRDRNGWRLCDLTLDHFSLAAILRAQFSDVLERPGGGFAALLLLLHEKSVS
jgi:ABC-type transporter MlaC component